MRVSLYMYSRLHCHTDGARSNYTLLGRGVSWELLEESWDTPTTHYSWKTIKRYCALTVMSVRFDFCPSKHTTSEILTRKMIMMIIVVVMIIITL